MPDVKERGTAVVVQQSATPHFSIDSIHDNITHWVIPSKTMQMIQVVT
ncbi:MAG: hypothetical protein AAFU78_22840 [Cyanobacteria bacterium J06633_2]